MKAIVKPEVVIHCQNPECSYSDECWRFRAFGGDDVTYKCPKCDSVAGLTAIKTKVLETEVVEEKETKMEELLFIVGDLHKGTVRVMKESVVQAAGLDDADILIPMVDSVDVGALNPRAREDFFMGLDTLCIAMDEGRLPILEEVSNWVDGIMTNSKEDTTTSVDSVVAEIDPIPLGDFKDGYRQGFSAGVIFGLNELGDHASPQIERAVAEPVEAPAVPETSTAPMPKITPKRKKALLKAMRKRGHRR